MSERILCALNLPDVLCIQAFKKLSRGFAKLADESESFQSKTILGLLRGAPDLLPGIKNVEGMFVSNGEMGESSLRSDPSP